MPISQTWTVHNEDCAFRSVKGRRAVLAKRDSASDMLKKSLYFKQGILAWREKLAKILFYLHIKMRIHAATLKMTELCSHLIQCGIQVNMLSCQAQHVKMKKKTEISLLNKQSTYRNCIFGSDWMQLFFVCLFPILILLLFYLLKIKNTTSAEFFRQFRIVFYEFYLMFISPNLTTHTHFGQKRITDLPCLALSMSPWT